MTTESTVFASAQVITTTLSPNSSVVVTASGDTNNDTQLGFQVSNGGTPIIYWSPLVSSSSLTAVNDKNRGNGVVTFAAGLTVTFLPQSEGYYTVTLDGTIIDSGTAYPQTGKSLGMFPICPC